MSSNTKLSYTHAYQGYVVQTRTQGGIFQTPSKMFEVFFTVINYYK